MDRAPYLREIEASRSGKATPQQAKVRSSVKIVTVVLLSLSLSLALALSSFGSSRIPNLSLLCLLALCVCVASARNAPGPIWTCHTVPLRLGFSTPALAPDPHTHTHTLTLTHTHTLTHTQVPMNEKQRGWSNVDRALLKGIEEVNVSAHPNPSKPLIISSFPDTCAHPPVAGV